MKALTILPPYAMHIWSGEKTVEVRTWTTKYRGDLLICSSNKRFRECVCGYGLAVANLMTVVPFIKKHLEPAMMNRMPDGKCYAWVLRNVRPIKPIPLKGYVSLWNADVEDKLEFLPRYPEECTLEEEEAWVKELIDPLIYAPARK